MMWITLCMLNPAPHRSMHRCCCEKSADCARHHIASEPLQNCSHILGTTHSIFKYFIPKTGLRSEKG